jgi:hypothetical protein
MSTAIKNLNVHPPLPHVQDAPEFWNISLKSSSNKPSLTELLYEIGPLPFGTLFAGCAEDGMPVLLNLHDPKPGPILLVGNHVSGKTELLRVLVHFVVSTLTPSEIQYAVITNRVEEWPERLADAPQCVGIFSSQEISAKRLVHAASTWIAEVENPGQSILILVDDFKQILNWDHVTLTHLYRVLKNGPQKRLWPIFTTLPKCPQEMHNWLALFRTRIVARDLVDRASGNNYQTGSNQDTLAPWFSILEHGVRVNFWTPNLGF